MGGGGGAREGARGVGKGVSCHEFTKHNFLFLDSRNYKRIQKFLT